MTRSDYVIFGIALLLFVASLLVSGCGQTNLQNKPITVQGGIAIEHKVSVDTSKLEQIYRARCVAEIDPLDFSSDALYQAEVNACTNIAVAEFLDVFQEIN